MTSLPKLRRSLKCGSLPVGARVQELTGVTGWLHHFSQPGSGEKGPLETRGLESKVQKFELFRSGLNFSSTISKKNLAI
jgi:hypothetical protein